MDKFRLRPVPFRKRVNLFQVFGIRDAAFTAGVKRVLIGFHAGEILVQEIRGLPKLVTLIKNLKPVFPEFEPEYAGNQHDGQKAEGVQKGHAVGDDETTDAIENIQLVFAYLPGTDRQYCQQ